MQDLFSYYQRNKWFLRVLGAAQAAGNHSNEWGLICYFWRGIHASAYVWIQSQTLETAVEVPRLKIFSYDTSPLWLRKSSQPV